MASALDPTSRIRQLAKTPSYSGELWAPAPGGRPVTGRIMASFGWASPPTVGFSKPVSAPLGYLRGTGIVIDDVCPLPRILPSFVGGEVVSLRPAVSVRAAEGLFRGFQWLSEQWSPQGSWSGRSANPDPDLPLLHELGACPPPYDYRAEVTEGQAARWALLVEELQGSSEEGLVRAPRGIPTPRRAWR